MAENRGANSQLQTIEELNAELTTLRARVKYKTSLSIFIIALMVMITTTLAWFTVSGLAGTDGLDMNCTTGSELRIATSNLGNDINAYEKQVTADMINAQLTANNYKVLNDIKLEPLSTQNASSDIGTRLFLQNGTERTAEGPGNGDYLLMNLWLISGNAVDVYLTDKESEDGANDGTKITSASTNTAAQADVVRTARISFAPEGESTKIYEVEQRGAASNQTNAFWNISENSDANKICSLEANTPKQITVRVWIEGEDPLCVDAVQQAGFSVQLKFEGDKIAN
ncbi:MAG: hypothetical protein IJG23_03500 [Clostridia bacterium]|nr:hypothetical protein [Clostridia bacterium]